MSRFQSTLVGLASCIVLATGFASNAAACESPGKKVQVKVTIDNGQPTVDPASVNVCVGDEVQWSFPGAAKAFKISFLNDVPFNWPDKSMKGATVKGTVKAGAVKNGQSTPYDYDVEIDGVAVDPKIIVDP